MPFWLENLVAKSRLHYPVFFIILNGALYLIGYAVAFITGNMEPYLSQPRWILMAVFGSLNGTAVLFSLGLFRRSLVSIRPLLKLEDEAWNSLQQDLLKRLVFPIYWIPVVFWLFFSGYHAFVLGSGWWTIGTCYAQPQLIAAYGYLYQGIAGCLLGGMLMGILPINLNLALWKLASQKGFSENIITRKGKSSFKAMKSLVILNTAMLVVSTGIAMSLWIEVLAPAPIIGSLAELIPTAVIPHYLFHGLLVQAKDRKLRDIEQDIAKTLKMGIEASIRDLIRFEASLREEEQITPETTWLVDLHAVFELLAVTFLHVIIVESLAIVLHF